MIRRLMVVLTALSLALPAIAAARTDPPHNPGSAAQSHGKQALSAGLTFHGRTAAAVSGKSQPVPRLAASTDESGFDWGDASIGAGLTLVVIAIAGGVFLAYRRGTGSIGPAPSRT